MDENTIRRKIYMIYKEQLVPTLDMLPRSLHNNKVFEGKFVALSLNI